MTGSWTLPAARGQGCFARIIDESCELCTAHGCAFLLAFVTHDNASRRRLEAAGSTMVPSRYIFTADDDEVRSELAVRSVPKDTEALWMHVQSDRFEKWHVRYPNLADFEQQCLKRAHPTRCLMVDDAIVLIEETETADRVVVASYESQDPADVLAAIAKRAHDAGRRFFAFAIGDLEVPGLAHKEGFLTILPTLHDEARIEPDTVLDWRIDAGDRM